MGTIIKLLALDKFTRLLKIIAQNGGPMAIGKLWRMDTLKEGKLMGTDSFGNKYYENNNYMISRSRWVEFAKHVRWEYDASQVTAEWYGWLHYKTDRLPSEDCAKVVLKKCCWTTTWMQPHVENMTGTPLAFYPYRTTRPHIVVWDGRNVCKRST